jgi:FkbM family methyltransferase
MFDRLKERSRRFIASNRERRSIRALHQLAAFVETGYENEDWDMYSNGETRLFRRLAPVRLETLFDVGANIGGWSVEALKTWQGSHIHAFEVAAPTFRRLVQRVEGLCLSPQMTLNCVGLSDVSGSREMYYFPEQPQLTCDMPRHPHAASTPFQAQLVQGDEYVAEHGIETIDFLKIDVEGAEHRVLKGLRNTLDAGCIHCIQFEYGAFSIQTRVLLADYYQMLDSRYWIGKIFPSGVEFRDYHWTMESFRFSNFFCVSRNRPDLKELAA